MYNLIKFLPRALLAKMRSSTSQCISPLHRFSFAGTPWIEVFLAEGVAMEFTARVFLKHRILLLLLLAMCEALAYGPGADDREMVDSVLHRADQPHPRGSVV